jgi:hypothetical protein
LNIQCLRNKIQELEVVLETNKFDILCFEEHWLVESEASCFTVGSYSVAEYFARKNHIHGGVIQFVNSSFECIPLPTVKTLSIEIDCELVGTFIPSLDVYIITVYRSPLGDFNMFIETMHKLLGKIDYKNKNLIIGGDFNMHFNTNNKYAQSFSDLLQSYGLYSHVKFPTRGLSAIDNVFSNIITEDIDVTPVNFHISDHLGISVNLRTNHFITRKSKVKIVRPLSDEGKFMFFKFFRKCKLEFCRFIF